MAHVRRVFVLKSTQRLPAAEAGGDTAERTSEKKGPSLSADCTRCG